MSLSLLINGTFVFRLPLPMLDDATIKLLIDLKKREENFIAIVIDRNNHKETITK